MYEKSYYGGIKAGNFINNYLYRDQPKMTREERQQIRQDNAYITLYGKAAFESDHERKSKGVWE